MGYWTFQKVIKVCASHSRLDIVLQIPAVLTAESTSQGLGRELRSWFQDYYLGKIPTKKESSKNETCDLESEALGYFFPLAMWQVYHLFLLERLISDILVSNINCCDY